MIQRLFVCQMYTSDSSYSQDAKDELFSSLQQQWNMKYVTKKSKKIILGEFNGRIGTNGIDTYPENCGKYGLGLMNNEIEER